MSLWSVHNSKLRLSVSTSRRHLPNGWGNLLPVLLHALSKKTIPTIGDTWRHLGQNTIQYNTIQYSTVQYSTIQYNTIQLPLIVWHNLYFFTLHKAQKCTRLDGTNSLIFVYSIKRRTCKQGWHTTPFYKHANVNVFPISQNSRINHQRL